MVAKPIGYNGMQVELVSHESSFQNWPNKRLHMKSCQQPFNRNSERNSSKNHSTSNSRCCSCPRTGTKPKAGTGANCNSNAQEQDKQHIELQKQDPKLAGQAPPYEIASAAKAAETAAEENQME